jgi:hypothetical protein
MQCALCLKDGQLRDSHILPEFLYESLYDDKHRLQVLSAEPSEPNSLRQKGLKERLLCDACEQSLSVWEGYARKVIRGELPLTMTGEGSLIRIEGLDYRSFKLFQLSILWRAGVSRQRFFEYVALGRHQEQLRSLLLNGDPGSPDRYACFMFGITYESGKVVDLISQPERKRALGQVAYSFVFGGFMWAYLVASQDAPIHMRSATLREDGSTVIQRQSAASMTNLMNFYDRLAGLGRVD